MDNMEIHEFIERFKELLEETDLSALTPETQFRKLEEWSSLTALSVIAMMDEEYGINMKGEELRVIKTIKELYDFVCYKR